MWSAVFGESWQELRRIKAHHGETEMRGTTLALRVIVLGLTSCVEDLQGFTFLIDFIRVESFGILRDSCCDTHKFGTKVGFEYWLTCMRMRVFPWLFELYSALAYFAWGEFWNKFYFWFDFFYVNCFFFFFVGMRGICFCLRASSVVGWGSQKRFWPLIQRFCTQWKCTPSLLFFFWFSWSAWDIYIIIWNGMLDWHERNLQCRSNDMMHPKPWLSCRRWGWGCYLLIIFDFRGREICLLI